MMWGYFGGPPGWAAYLGVLVFWAFVVGGAVLVFRSWTVKRDTVPDALEILKRRYASGEITGEEFAHMREYLGPH